MTAATPPESALICASAWRRFLAALVDAALNTGLSLVTLLPLLRESVESRSLLPVVGLSIIETVFFLWLVVRFGLTPGKYVARIRIVDQGGAFPNWSRALLRAFPGILGGILGTVQMNAMIHSVPLPVGPLSFTEFGRLLHDHGHRYVRLEHALTAFQFVDIGAILLNRRRRAIHDFVAGTYVVTRESWVAHGTGAPSVLS